jgi:predicted nucleic acid-binding protein
MDAARAAQALQHGDALCTTDRDFLRFPGLRLMDPSMS